MSIVETRTNAANSRVIMILAGGLALAGVFLPTLASGARGDEIAWLSLALPPVVFAILLIAPEAFGVTDKRSGKRQPNLLPAVSVMGLFLSAKGEGFLAVTPALTLAGFGAVIVLVLGLGIAGRRLPGPLWLWAVLLAASGGAYGYGATAFADTHFDRGPGQVFRARIEREYVSRGRSSSTPHLVLAPWGPASRETNIAVSSQTYRSLKVGDTACVTLRPGELGMPWYKAAVCDLPG